MSGDVATLGIAINTTQITAATAALDRLAASGRPAEVALNSLQKASAGFASDLQKAVSDINDMSAVGKNGLDQLRAKYSPLFAAQQQYKQQLADIRDAHRVGALTQTEMTSAITATKGAFVAQVATIRGVASAHANLSTQSMSAFHALRSMAEGAALGLPPFQILAQQMNHLSYAASGPGGLSGAFGGVLQIVRSMITPTVALIGGFAALGGAAYGAYSFWKGFALQLDDTAKIMGVTTSEAAKLQAAAEFKGIDPKEFADAMKRVATNVYEVKANVGSAAETFRVAGVQVKDMNGYLDASADLIKQNAGSTARQFAILQQLGLPATMEWVRLLEQGGEGLKRAKDQATEFGSVANTEMIEKAREFDEWWSKTWLNFKTDSRSAIVETGTWLDWLADKGRAGLRAIGLATERGQGVNMLKSGLGTPLRTNFDELYSKLGINDPAKQPAPDKDIIQKQIAQQQQHIGVLGNLASIQETVLQQKNAITLANIAGAKVTDEETKKLLAYTEASALGTLQIRQQAESLRIEAEAAGLGTAAATAFKTEQEKLAEFRARGITLTKDQAAALHKEAIALGEVTEASKLRTAEMDASFAASQLGRTASEQQVATALRQIYGPEYQSHLDDDAIAGQLRLNSVMLDTKTIGESALSGLIRDLRDGKSAGEAFKNVLIKLEDKLIDIASNQIMSGLLGKSGQGLLGSLFSPGGDAGGKGVGGVDGAIVSTNHSGYGPGDPSGLLRMVSASAFAGAPRFHSGVGPHERAAILTKDESVLTPGQMRAIGGRGGGKVNVTINNSVSNDVSATPETRQNPDGSVDIEVAIERVVNRTIASGRADKSLRRHGASPVTTRR